jgi:uncharacterized protein YegP (UPF0339 family)
MPKLAEVIEYRDKRGEYRWRIVRNGRCLADSGEGYKRRVDMRKALVSVSAGILAYRNRIVTPKK